MEFDHVFVCVQPGAVEAGLLIDAGFTEGPSNSHPGQGTANRSFFFANAFIEFLFEQNHDELCSEQTRPTNLQERLNRTDAGTSPFGFCFRPVKQGPCEVENESACPFPAWAYQPEYLPAQLAIDIADTPLTEPMWFYLGFSQRPDVSGRVALENLQHANGVCAITGITVTVPRDAHLSPVAALIAKNGSVGLQRGDDHLVEFEFDHNKTGDQIDMRPDVPVVLRW